MYCKYPEYLRRIHILFGEHTRIEMKVRTIHAHQSRQQHSLHGVRIVRHMIAIHKNALFRGMSMKIDIHEKIARRRRITGTG